MRETAKAMRHLTVKFIVSKYKYEDFRQIGWLVCVRNKDTETV